MLAQRTLTTAIVFKIDTPANGHCLFPKSNSIDRYGYWDWAFRFTAFAFQLTRPRSLNGNRSIEFDCINLCVFGNNAMIRMDFLWITNALSHFTIENVYELKTHQLLTFTPVHRSTSDCMNHCVEVGLCAEWIKVATMWRLFRMGRHRQFSSELIILDRTEIEKLLSDRISLSLSLYNSSELLHIATCGWKRF